MPETSSSRRTAAALKALAAIALGTIALALYLRTGAFGYIRLDDWGYTAGCPFVNGGLTLGAVKEAFSRVTYGGIWMPLTYLSYAADITFVGGGWGVHHIVNALLHAINAAVVFWFILALVPASAAAARAGRCRILAAFLAAAIWLVHPQRVEAVAWIASRKEELFALFTLLGLISWRSRRWGSGIVCCALACLSKPTAVCFPLLAALVEWYAHALESNLTSRPAPGPRTLHLLARYTPLFAMAAITGLAAIASQTSPEDIGEIAVLHIPFLKRLVIFFYALALSLGQMVIPWGLHFDYLLPCAIIPAATPAAPSAPAAPASDISLRRLAIFAAAFFLVAYLPVSGLAGSFGETLRADRFLYLPSAGIAALLAGVLMRFRRAMPLAMLALFAYAGAAWPLISSYRNDFTAFSRALELSPRHWRALSHVGAEYCARLGKMDEGIELMRSSYRLSPRASTAETLAYSLACRGNIEDVPEIRRLASRFVRLASGDTRGMFAESLGIAEKLVGDWQGAETCFKASIAAPKRFYSDTSARLHLAEVLARRGALAEARSTLAPLLVSDSPEERRRAIETLSALKDPASP